MVIEPDIILAVTYEFYSVLSTKPVLDKHRKVLL